MQGLACVTAAILVGGLVTRLRLVTDGRPKALIEIQGRTFLLYLLDQLVTAGVREVVLCTGYQGQQVKAAFGDIYGSLRLRYSQELSPLGTAGALRLSLPLLNSDPVLVMNGDSFCDLDLNKFLAWHCARGASATLALVNVSDASRYGRVDVDGSGRVVCFQEKDGTRSPGWINAGVYLIARSFLQTIPAECRIALEREVFPAWVGKALYGYQTEARFLDIGTPETYAEAEQFFAKQALR